MKYLVFLLVILGLACGLYAEDTASDNLDATVELQSDEGSNDELDELDELDNMDVEFARAPGIRSRVVGDKILLSAAVGLSILDYDFKNKNASIWGIPAVVNIGYRFSKAYELSSLGMTAFSVGLNTGVLQLANGEDINQHNFRAISVPVIPYAKMHFKYIDFQFGIGGHYWYLFDRVVFNNAQADGVKDTSGLDVAATYAFSYNYEIKRELHMELSVRGYYAKVYSDSEVFESYDYPLYMLTVGLTYQM